MTIIDPLLLDLGLHLCLAVEGSQHSVDSAEQLGVLFSVDALVISVGGGLNEGPELGRDRFKLCLVHQLPLFSFGNDQLYNVV